VGGASAMGMVNPHSQTQALPQFRQYMSKLPLGDRLLFVLGEVDCGFVIWYRAAKYKLDVDSQLQHSLDCYCRFLREVVAQRPGRVAVCAVVPPVIEDGTLWSGSSSARREVTASLQERAQLTRRYNDALRSFCLGVGCGFLDLEDVLDGEGRVLPQYRHAQPNNHHLTASSMAGLLQRKLAATFSLAGDTG
jgi:hypothetical protein